MIVAATGHRPQKLTGWSRGGETELMDIAIVRLLDLDPKKVITGMALGWDQVVACAALRMGIPVIAAVPFPQQPDPWRPTQKLLYSHILERCAEVHMLADHYSAHNLQKRNEWMVDHSDRILALWDGKPGGTANCVVYACNREVPVENCWDDWAERSAKLGSY